MENPHENKKTLLEDLSREELIEKCKNLLNLAQKAKSTKDAYLQENEMLKNRLVELENNKVAEELIENLTQQKLSLVSEIDKLKIEKKVAADKIKQYEESVLNLENKVSEFDTQNQSFQRQVKRLSDENESLITDLDNLSQQIIDLQNVNTSLNEKINDLVKDNEEKSALIELKEKTEAIKKFHDKIEELQKRNSKLIEEKQEIIVKSDELKGENDKIQKHNKELENEASELKKIVSEYENAMIHIKKKSKEKDEQIESYINSRDDLNTELHKNRALIEKLQNDLSSTSAKLADNQIVSSGITTDLQNVNEKLKERLKMYHSKVVKFAKDVKHLKEVKNVLISDIKMYLNETQNWQKQLEILSQNFEKDLNSIKHENVVLNSDLDNCKVINENLLKENEKFMKNEQNYLSKICELEKNNSDLTECCKKLKDYYNKLISELNLEENVELDVIMKEVKNLKENENLKLELQNLVSKLQNEMLTVKNRNEILEKELESLKNAEIGLAEQSRREIVKLNEEITKLTSANENLLKGKKPSSNNNKDTQTENTTALKEDSELEETVNVLKREHDELLSEMNLMNQELKERGEMISKLQEHGEELRKKIKIFETQNNKANELIQSKEEFISQLSAEVEELRHRTDENEPENAQKLHDVIEELKQKVIALENAQDNNYTDVETMSTSTISKMDEVNRLKDLEGSWEEKYSKLRSLAVKLKGKVRDLETAIAKEQEEKNELVQKVVTASKTIQTLQSKCDEVEDDLEASRKEVTTLTKKLDGAAMEISNNKRQLALNDENISELKVQLENLTKEKASIDNWKKQVGGKVQTLRKELEAKGLLMKDLEGQIVKLKSEIETKDKLLKEEMDRHKETKSLLQESNTECKKQSVLNLEMQDYERSLRDLSQKLEKKQEMINSLKDQVDAQKNTLNALKEQNRVLEERFQTGEADLEDARKRIKAYQKNVNNLETDLLNKDEKIGDMTNAIENLRLQNEELCRELSNVIAEHQKTNLSLKSEKEYLRSQNLGLEQRLRELQNTLHMKEEELTLTQNDYQSYKVRAQSVLRQNQTRDVALEEKMGQELTSAKAQIDIIMEQLNMAKIEVKNLTEENAKLILDKEKVELRLKQTENELEDCKKQCSELKGKYRAVVSENSDSIKNLKAHLETVTQCYKQQLSEQEVRHNREIIELQSKLEKGSSLPENVPVVVPAMPREEGEGSESVDSSNISRNYPVPLERLMNDDYYQETSFVKKQLAENEAKVAHLTSLLADTEQDLAKHVQMNKLLKEEIRRQQRSVEREEHAENLEYLKNVVYKFATLTSGDEKSRLVPVLNTILKFSKEETQKLNEVARGEGGRGWTNYLPTWSSSPNKPQ